MLLCWASRIGWGCATCLSKQLRGGHIPNRAQAPRPYITVIVDFPLSLTWSKISASCPYIICSTWQEQTWSHRMLTHEHWGVWCAQVPLKWLKKLWVINQLQANKGGTKGDVTSNHCSFGYFARPKISFCSQNCLQNHRMSSTDLNKQIIWLQEMVSPITFFPKCTSLQKQPFPSLMVSSELTSSVHQPHFSPAWMHSPQDWAEALVHSLPSEHTHTHTHTKNIHHSQFPPTTNTGNPNQRAFNN